MNAYIINRVLFAWLIIMPSLGIIMDTFDAAGRFPTFLMVLGLIYSYKEGFRLKSTLFNPIIIWIIWDIVAAVHWVFVGINFSTQPNWVYIRNLFITSPICMILAYHEASKNLKDFVLYIMICFSLFCVIGLVFQDAGSGQGTGWDARGGGQLGNTLPLTSIVLAFLAYFSYSKEWIRKSILYAIIILCIACILFVATRKAFIALIILSFFYGLGRINFYNPKQIIGLLFAFIIVYFGIEYVLTSTTLGVRFSSANDSDNIYATNTFLQLVGDRAFMYVLGWDAFLENPILGIGLNNFKPITNSEYVLHTEYMVQLCECGIIGSALFVLFYTLMVRLCIKIRSVGYKTDFFIILGFIFALLFMSLTAWTYSFPRYFIVFGIIIAFCMNARKK